MRRPRRREAARTDTGETRARPDARDVDANPPTVVELDLVDTLFSLPVPDPDDLLDLLAPEVARALGLRSIAYRTLRTRARRLAASRASAVDRSRRPYDEALDVLGVELGLDEDRRRALRAIEVAAYRRLLAPRPRGRAVLDDVRRLGRRLVLRVPASLPPEVVTELVSQHGVDEHELCFVDDDRVPGARRTEIPSAFSRFRETPLHARVFAADASTHSPSVRALLGTMACLHDADEARFPSTSSLFGGDAYRLGHDALGPLLLGFAKWTLETAKDRGYERLLFLARDGKIVQRAYELVARCYEDVPRSCYVLCSRRATHVAGLSTPTDVYQCVWSSAEDLPLRDILVRRLGLDSESSEGSLAMRHGLDASMSLAALSAREPAFVAFLHDLVPRVLANSAREREAYLAYLDGLGLSSLRGAAVVDVGYSGTMQAALDSLFGGDTRLGGLYLLTYRSILANVEAHGMHAHAYAAERIDPTDTDHSFVRFAYLYETMFSGLDTSFVRIDRRPDGTLDPVFVPPHADELRRVAFVSELQRGALAFVDAFTARWGSSLRTLDLDPRKTMRVTSSFFERPDAEDARHFQGIPHEDVFGAHGVNAILPEDARLRDARCVWEPGRKALLEDRGRGQSDRRVARHPRIVRESMRVGSSWLRWGVDLAASHFLPHAKLEKLRRDPAAFFADASSPVVRAVGRAIAEPSEDD